jgi:hypothetical protein
MQIFQPFAIQITHKYKYFYKLQPHFYYYITHL